MRFIQIIQSFLEIILNYMPDIRKLFELNKFISKVR